MYAACCDELQKIAASKARMRVAQTRSGRRPIRADTLLRKEKEGTLFKKAGERGLKKRKTVGVPTLDSHQAAPAVESTQTNRATTTLVPTGTVTNNDVY